MLFRGAAVLFLGAVAPLAFCFTASAQTVYYKHLRWLDSNASLDGGFVLHTLSPNGDVKDIVYRIGDPDLLSYGFVYGVFLEIEPGETCVSVSRYFEGGEWSESSRVRCFRHDEPELSACNRADLNNDGVVGGPDWSIFASSYGSRCD